MKSKIKPLLLAFFTLTFFTSMSYSQTMMERPKSKLIYTMRVGKAGFTTDKIDSTERYFTYYLLADTPFQYRLIGFNTNMVEDSLLKDAPFVKDKCPVNTTFFQSTDQIYRDVHIYLEKCWATGVQEKKAISYVVKTYLEHRSEINWTKFL
jgi:hypothetical protein